MPRPLAVNRFGSECWSLTSRGWEWCPYAHNILDQIKHLIFSMYIPMHLFCMVWFISTSIRLRRMALAGGCQMGIEQGSLCSTSIWLERRRRRRWWWSRSSGL